MSITKLIEQLNAMPEKMEGFNSEGELVVLNTHKAAEGLKNSLRNCDVGTTKDQCARFQRFCDKYTICHKCPLWRGGGPVYRCYSFWSNLLYKKGETK